MSESTVNYAPAEWLLRAHRRWGPIFFGQLGLQRYVYLTGPDANAFVFANDALFSAREAFRGLIPVDGPTSVIVSDGDEHTRRRAAIRPGLHHRRVNGYLEIMSLTADDALDAATASFDAYQTFRAAIRRSTLHSLFGEDMATESDRLGLLLQPIIDLTDQIPDLIDWHRRLRSPRWRRAMTARAQVDAFIHAQIAQQRSHPEKDEGTVLATLVHGRDGTGSGLSDQEIRDQTVTLIAAGFETTSAAMAWAIHSLASNPDVQERARAEVLDTLRPEPVTIEQLRALTYLDAVVSETLRLYPPATISARHVAHEFTFSGKRVRPGTMLLYSPYVTHRDEKVYDRPRVFDPTRWLEGRTRPGNEYLPFGGGVHRCIGSTMAQTELVVMVARLLQRGRVELTQTRPVTAKGFAAMRPKSGLQVRLLP